MSTNTTSIRPLITWVSDKPSTTGKTVRCLLSDPSFDQKVVHFTYLPVAWAPEKFNLVEATTVKLGDIETEYEDPATGAMVPLQQARRQVSLYGEVALCDGDPLPESTFVDKRTKSVNSDRIVISLGD